MKTNAVYYVQERSGSFKNLYRVNLIDQGGSVLKSETYMRTKVLWTKSAYTTTP